MITPRQQHSSEHNPDFRFGVSVLLLCVAGAVAISAGKEHSMLLQQGGGSVWTTGWGDTGRLGSGALNREKLFVKAMALGEILGRNCTHKHRRTSLVRPFIHSLSHFEPKRCSLSHATLTREMRPYCTSPCVSFACTLTTLFVLHNLTVNFDKCTNAQPV